MSGVFEYGYKRLEFAYSFRSIFSLSIRHVLLAADAILFSFSYYCRGDWGLLLISRHPEASTDPAA